MRQATSPLSPQLLGWNGFVFGVLRAVGRMRSPVLRCCPNWSSLLFFHVPLYEQEYMSGPEDGFTLMAGHVRPLSRGYLALRSADPEAELLIDPQYLAEEHDVDALEESVRICREIAAGMDEWNAEELYPGPGVRSSEAVRDYIRATAETYHHQVGTCKMGLDAMAVVDPELRVHGVDGLRVVDASIMPDVVSGNTNAPVIMIAEKAVDMIKATND